VSGASSPTAADPVAPAITRLVARHWPAATVTELLPLAGDFSTRRYLRARLAGADAPSTIVVMVLSGSGLPLSSEELAIFDTPPIELPFLDVQRLLAELGAPVPEVYEYDQDNGVLLLEDGGDVLLWDRASATPADVETLYRRAIDVLLLLHTRGTTHPDRSSIAFAQRFDRRLYAWELEHFLEYGVERRLDAPLPPSTRARFENAFATLIEPLLAVEPVLSHRDFHSWNILVRDDQPFVIDFQDALLAPPEYDLASLLTDRVTPRLVTPDIEDRLLRYYWSERGGQYDRERYLLSVLQRALKVIGRVQYVAIEKGKPAPLAFLPDVVATARRALAELDGVDTLAEEFAALPWPEPR
jgi:aminoglycoside/choline kinase family phosphotransferase